MAIGAATTIPDWLPTVLAGLVLFTAAFFAAHAIASGWIGAAAPTGTAQAAALYTLCYYLGSSVLGWAAGLAVASGWIAVAGAVVGMTLATMVIACARPLTLRSALTASPAGHPGNAET